MKRVLFVHHVSVVGGASYCLLNIIKELDRDKYYPIVLLRDDGSLVCELRQLDVEVHFFSELWYFPYNKSLCNLRRLWKILRLYNSLKGFDKWLEKCNPDIVYFNNMLLFPYLKVTKRKRMKSVIHIREHWPENSHKRQLLYIKKEILSKADRLVAINEYSARMITPDNNRVTIVHDWIDLEQRYEPFPISVLFGEDVIERKIFLYTGGLQRIKGAYEVLKSFHEHITHHDCRLLVLGFTKTFSGNGLRGVIKRLLCAIGYPTYEYKVKAIAQKDSRIVCIPSVYNIKDLLDQTYCMLSYFTIPHANLAMAEAIWEGVPCIAARTEESLEYSHNGDYALLYTMNDMHSFVDCIMNLEGTYSSLKESLRLHSQEIKEKFSKEANSRRLMAVLNSF